MKATHIFDIDGTLTDCGWRMQEVMEKNWNKFHALAKHDPPVKHIVEVCQLLQSNGHNIVLMTGRPECFRDETVEQMSKMNITFTELRMRQLDDFRSDADMKLDWVNELEEKCDIGCIWDDRPGVIRIMREHKYNAVQCGEGW